MAKVTKLIGSLVGVSALWLGSTAYISSNSQKYLDAYVAKTNSIYAANGMKMSIENYKKGFFSSTAEFNIDFTDPKMKTLIEKTLKLPIKVNYEIEHGPILFKNGLDFGASRIKNSINMNKYYADNAEIKKYLKSDIIIDSNTVIGFTNNAKYEVSSNKIVIDLDGNDLVISPLKMTGNMNVKTFQGSMKMNIDSVSVEHDNEFFKANNLSMNAKLQKVFDNGFYLGKFIFDINKIDTKGVNLPFSLENAKLNMIVDINQNKDKTVNLDFKIKGDAGSSKLPEDYAFVKQADISYSLHGMKLEGLLAFQDFAKKLQVKQQDILSRLNSPKTGEMDMDVYNELQQMQIEAGKETMVLMAGLLKKDSSSLSFATHLLDKKDKKSILNMNIGYVGDIELPKDAKALEETFKKELLNLLSLKFNVTLEKAYIDNLPQQLQDALSAQIQMGSMFGVVKDNNNSYSFDVDYKPKTLLVNGENRTEMLQPLEEKLLQK